MEIKELMKARSALMEKELSAYLDHADPDLKTLFEAMSYSLIGGGKRLRSFLVTEFARLSATEQGTDPEKAMKASMPFACAIEMVHTYSLIHDDLPCMDDDNLRRGKPTNHVVFGEANALLAGDALLTKAFEVVASNRTVPTETVVKAVSLLASAAGPDGMVGGQVLDLIGETKTFDMDTLVKLQALKTGELIRAATLLGCYAGNASERLIAAATNYALGIGRAFQVVDDILDVTGDEATLGKPIGSDAESGKTTFLSFLSVEDARSYAARLTANAVSAIRPFRSSETLTALAEYLITRNL